MPLHDTAVTFCSIMCVDSPVRSQGRHRVSEPLRPGQLSARACGGSSAVTRGRSGAPAAVSPHTPCPFLRHASFWKEVPACARCKILLGHSDIMATEIYTHVQSDQMIALHRKFHPTRDRLNPCPRHSFAPLRSSLPRQCRFRRPGRHDRGQPSSIGAVLDPTAPRAFARDYFVQSAMSSSIFAASRTSSKLRSGWSWSTTSSDPAWHMWSAPARP